MPDVTLLGATYQGVPAVVLPKMGGGTARFTDVTATTAKAADVAKGKTFYAADGTLTTGTATGAAVVAVEDAEDEHGGTVRTITAVDLTGDTVDAEHLATGYTAHTASGERITGTMAGAAPYQVGVIRPDAELVQRWSADERIVADLGLTLPAYKTSAQTIKTGAALGTVPVDFAHYTYIVYFRGLATPDYSTETKQKGRCDYGAAAYLHELCEIPANEMESVDGSKAITTRQAAVQTQSIGRHVYWTSATAIAVANSVAYGAYVTSQAPTISGTNLTVKAPVYGIRGNTTQMTSGAWSHMTDIREQWIIEVWRAPKVEVEGWGAMSSMRDILADIRDGGTLKA